MRALRGQAPARVELVCAADLSSDLVRRRGAFHVTDAARIAAHARYAVQKIARDGATHTAAVTAEPL
jgi:hypothetical protein